MADAPHAAVDQALAEWRQGDCVLGEQTFVFRFDPTEPVSDAAQDAATDGANAGTNDLTASAEGDVNHLAAAEVRGFAVLTQTCDLVRETALQPFVEVCPLIAIDATKLHEARLGKMPGRGYIPGVAGLGLVADLHRTMTVEKPVVACWGRTPGCNSDEEARAFAKALARKRLRFAFPDDFVELLADFRRHVTNKHAKNSDEGRLLAEALEFRVHADPSWDAPKVTLTFWCIRPANSSFSNATWLAQLDDWLKCISLGGRFCALHRMVSTLADMTAADYLSSDALDLEHLSTPRR
jgi:hypothetical protein